MSPTPRPHRLEQHSLDALAARAWAENPRRHDLESIAASLDRYGYVSLLVIDETSGRLVAGHGVLAALLIRREDGQSPPDRVAVQDGQWLVTAVHVHLAEGDATGYAVSETRTRELGGWHDERLVAVLQELAEQDPTLYGIGFTPEDLTSLQARVSGALPESFTALDDPTDPTQPTRKPVTCPHCGQTFTP